MHSLSEEALKKLSEVHEFEAKQYMKVVARIKKLGFEDHASKAVMGLEKSGAILTRM